jgi:hypothetical protein
MVYDQGGISKLDSSTFLSGSCSALQAGAFENWKQFLFLFIISVIPSDFALSTIHIHNSLSDNYHAQPRLNLYFPAMALFEDLQLAWHSEMSKFELTWLIEPSPGSNLMTNINNSLCINEQQNIQDRNSSWLWCGWHTLFFFEFTTKVKYLASIIHHSLTSDAGVDKHIRPALAAFGAL